MAGAIPPHPARHNAECPVARAIERHLVKCPPNAFGRRRCVCLRDRRVALCHGRRMCWRMSCGRSVDDRARSSGAWESRTQAATRPAHARLPTSTRDRPPVPTPPSPLRALGRGTANFSSWTCFNLRFRANGPGHCKRAILPHPKRQTLPPGRPRSRCPVFRRSPSRAEAMLESAQRGGYAPEQSVD